jgi:hypothetical protein
LEPALEDIPFEVCETPAPDERVHALFRKSFNAPAPDYPRHFVALYKRAGVERVAGYIHYLGFDSGVFLCGGLCVDTRIYRLLSSGERKAVAAVGSLSRWLIADSIAALGRKRAVFAFTGDRRSRKDAFAVGFIPTPMHSVLVQWHDAAESERAALIARVAAQGPF